jgi:hypothetical protein
MSANLGKQSGHAAAAIKVPKAPSFSSLKFIAFTHNAPHQRQSARVASTLSDCMRLL